MANPKGKNGREQKPWADAIKRALARAEHSPAEAHRTINALAERLLELGAAGDLPALREIADRLDGKPAQSTDLTINDRRTATDLTNDELAHIAAGGGEGTADETTGSGEPAQVH